MTAGFIVQNRYMEIDAEHSMAGKKKLKNIEGYRL